ncbi:hypothetical protein [Nocardia sp. NPDC052566]|uniref:hypothetical protein n=1 Tax=Nocardia sp. NPDC052566 TaxID=3364330 RepID=UPI0037CAE0F3
MTTEARSLMILIAGPYRSGTGDNPEKPAANVRVMNETALTLTEIPSAAARSQS